eukprot:402518_1
MVYLLLHHVIDIISLILITASLHVIVSKFNFSNCILAACDTLRTAIPKYLKHSPNGSIQYNCGPNNLSSSYTPNKHDTPNACTYTATRDNSFPIYIIYLLYY